MGSLLDQIYGIFVQPTATFESLRQRPLVGQSAAIVALVSALGMGEWNAFAILGAALAGCLGWVVLNGILWLLAYSVGRDPQWSGLLTLTGFASLPWLLWIPAQLWGPTLGAVLAVVVGLWFVAWQVWAASVALQVSWRRLLLVIPGAFLGIGVAISWLANSIGLLVSLG
ncbi:MAG: hypothetical protein OHK0012_00960 [Synechococcales cyanobacterium]